MTTKPTQQMTADKPLIIPVFIMNSGCKEPCVYCNQKISAGNYPQMVSRDIFNAEVDSYLRWNKDKLRRAQIAFYGGSFTALSTAYQKRLLTWANTYIRQGMADSVRISTRPDTIDETHLDFLKKYRVETIEIGAQSFNDDILKAAGRNHNAEAISESVQLLKSHGFKTGLHLMAGLPGDSREGFLYSLQHTISLKPDMVRIHPLIVFKDTPLEQSFREGTYIPLSLDEAVEYCCMAWRMLTPEGIPIIRFGLQMTPEMSQTGAYVAGPLHPAFGALVYSEIFYQYTAGVLRNVPTRVRELHFNLSDHDASHFRGLNNRNISKIKKQYPDAHIAIETSSVATPGVIRVETDTGEILSVDIANAH